MRDRVSRNYKHGDMARPWYRDGLRFSCTGCGKCCTGEPGFVWVNREEIKALADALDLTAAEFERRYVRGVGLRKSLAERDNGDCVLFDRDGRQCRAYRARPRQCRAWPFWPSNLASPAAWQRAAQRCPGCNRGRLFSREEIRKLQ